ncbi:hypothetical protein FKB34_16210 [Glycocaulis profundi]|nr:hypothetical protein FKB34_16210 [Glycocaulis profundi]
MRVFLIIIALFVLPFAGYYIWRGIQAAGAGRPASAPEGEPAPETDGLPPAPIRTLALIGVVFVIVGLGGLALSGTFQGGRDVQYRPPTLEDGRISPARVEPRG